MFNKEKLLLITFLLIIANFIGCNVQQNDINRKQLFDLNWKFNKGTQAFASEVNFNDQNWQSIDLPHDWSNDAELVKTLENKPDSDSLETGWYRKHFQIPENWLDKNIFIDFEGISNHAEIFVNGTSIRHSKNENTSFQAVLNPYLSAHGNNIIAIRVVMPKQSDYGEFGTGIYKHVWLVIKDSSEFKD